MKINFKAIWENKWKIVSGIWNTLFPTKYIERVAQERITICKTNVCGFYDELGVMENTIVKNKPACGGCGCNAEYKTHSLSSWCYLKDLGKTPLWDSVMTEQEEELFRAKRGVDK